MPIHSKSTEISRHSTYWLPGGDLHILTGNIVFYVHHYFFEQDSFMFKTWLKDADDTPLHPQGATLATAFILNGISPKKFASFLWMFDNSTYFLYNTKFCKQWLGI
jgi:hypothetical protein